MNIEIKKGVPVPKIDRGGKGRPMKYPWLEMEVGDSFDTGCDDPNRHFPSAGTVACARNGLKRKFTQRMVGGTLMVWRTE